MTIFSNFANRLLFATALLAAHTFAAGQITSNQFRAAFNLSFTQTPEQGGTYRVVGLFQNLDPAKDSLGRAYTAADIKIDTTIFEDNQSRRYRVVWSSGTSPLTLELDPIAPTSQAPQGGLGALYHSDGDFPLRTSAISAKLEASQDAFFKAQIWQLLQTSVAPLSTVIRNDSVFIAQGGQEFFSGMLGGSSQPIGTVVRNDSVFITQGGQEFYSGQNIAGEPFQLATNRPISRTNWDDLAGQQLGQDLTTEQFFERLLFPVTPPALNLSAPPTISYATWSNWSSSDSIIVNWQAINQSYQDATTNTPIDSIVLYADGEQFFSFTQDGLNQLGIASFKPNPLPAASVGQTIQFTGVVRDTAGNEGLDKAEVQLAPAIQLAASLGRGTANPIELDDAANVLINWTVTLNDEALDDILFDGASQGNATTGQVTTAMPTPGSNGASASFSLVFDGSIYDPVTRSIAYQWSHRIYRGVIADGDPVNTDDIVLANDIESRLANSWTNSNEFVVPAGQSYNVWFAVPDYVSVDNLQVFVDLTGQWTNVTGSDLEQYTITAFEHANGYDSLDYTVYVARIPYQDATVQFRLN